MPATSSEGRRAAQASAAPMDNDQAERDANLKKVQARDLVEFGMIPVRMTSNRLHGDDFLTLSFVLGICRSIPCFSSVPLVGCRYACENIDRTEECFGATISRFIGHGPSRVIFHIRSFASDRKIGDGKTNWSTWIESNYGTHDIK